MSFIATTLRNNPSAPSLAKILFNFFLHFLQFFSFFFHDYRLFCIKIEKINEKDPSKRRNRKKMPKIRSVAGTDSEREKLRRPQTRAEGIRKAKTELRSTTQDWNFLPHS
eukprot:NP_508271.2 Uncharacterized protein CELE_W05H7.2 [Caenorhabditis elegans]